MKSGKKPVRSDSNQKKSKINKTIDISKHF